jgi:hypothetical protein
MTLPTRTYTVTCDSVELLNLILSFGISLINIAIESRNNFQILVHHNRVTIKYNVPYISISTKRSSPKGLSPGGVSQITIR